MNKISLLIFLPSLLCASLGDESGFLRPAESFAFGESAWALHPSAAAVFHENPSRAAAGRQSCFYFSQVTPDIFRPSVEINGRHTAGSIIAEFPVGSHGGLGLSYAWSGFRDLLRDSWGVASGSEPVSFRALGAAADISFSWFSRARKLDGEQLREYNNRLQQLTLKERLQMKNSIARDVFGIPVSLGLSITPLTYVYSENNSFSRAFALLFGTGFSAEFTPGLTFGLALRDISTPVTYEGRRMLLPFKSSIAITWVQSWKFFELSLAEGWQASWGGGDEIMSSLNTGRGGVMDADNQGLVTSMSFAWKNSERPGRRAGLKRAALLMHERTDFVTALNLGAGLSFDFGNDLRSLRISWSLERRRYGGSTQAVSLSYHFLERL